MKEKEQSIPYQLSEYQRDATRTFKKCGRLEEHEVRILNWIVGLCNETGELAGVIKHQIFHKEPAQRMELAKELGDVLWYLAALSTSLNLDLDLCARLNIAKLQHRHGGGYNADGSKNRHKQEQLFEDTDVYKLLKGMIEKC